MGKEYLYTGILRACIAGDIEKIKLLLEDRTKIDINIQDNGGRTPLILASGLGNTEVVELLLKYGADVNIQNQDGMTALELALFNKHEEIIEMLLKHGADVNIQNQDGMTALISYSGSGDKEVVKILLKHGADVNIQEKSGFTALMIASGNGHKKIVEMLLDNGADVNIQEKDGFTAGILAIVKGNKEIVKLLGKYGSTFLGKSLELYDENNTLILKENINDGFYAQISVFNNKIYSYSHTSNYDLQSNKIYEYKINGYGFKVYQKLVEDKTKYNGEKEFYDVKDGNVLEDDIIERYNKDKLLMGSILKEPDEEIQRLKKECQWHELTFYKIKYFILSRHPEIISGQELIKYFRSELERIELGISKVKDLCNKYNFKLEFISQHSFGLLANHEESKFYDLLFLNEKDKDQEKRELFNNKLQNLLVQIECTKYEIERSEDIINTLNKYLDNNGK